MTKAPSDTTLLSVEDLRVWFHLDGEVRKTIDGASFSVPRRGMLGLVGESGSGKTVIANALLRYVREPGRIIGGRVSFDGVDLFQLSEERLNREYRGSRIGLIAANARAHLNPLRRVGDQIGDAYIAHHPNTRRYEAFERAVQVLRSVGINDPEERARSYPHELSGGMAQRIMIALVLVNSPRLLVADDCTNGLDVTVAAQVMELFEDLLMQHDSSGVLITHDLGLVARYCRTVAILHQGKIVESGTTEAFFDSPQHPYSVRLLESLPERKLTEEIGIR